MMLVRGRLGMPWLFATRKIVAFHFILKIFTVFDPMIARTFILPFREHSDNEGVEFGDDTLLINFGEDIDRNLVCVTTNRIDPGVASMLFPKTAIGMANLVTALINSAYAAMTPDEWLELLEEADEDY